MQELPYSKRRISQFTYPWASIVAVFHDKTESFLGFRSVKNKARDIRLFHIWCPTNTSKTLLFGFSQWFLHHFRREDNAKILKILNSPYFLTRFFHKNVWVTHFIVQIVKTPMRQTIRIRLNTEFA